jgi:Phosphoserine aminotransferase
MSTVTRIYNFAAGPAILPLPVLEEAQRDLVSLPGIGMSIMEISHRSSTFENFLHQAIADIRELGRRTVALQNPHAAGRRQPSILHGSDEFAHPGATADYIDTGSWSDKAIKEARRVGNVNVTGSTKADKYSRIPSGAELKFLQALLMST